MNLHTFARNSFGLSANQKKNCCPSKAYATAGERLQKEIKILQEGQAAKCPKANGK